MGIKPIKVSQIKQYIKRILQSDPLLGNISVTGEISNLKYHGSGHVYFTLKDADSKLSCFLPAEALARVRYELEDGMEIIASGFVTVYERGGTYSLTVKEIEVAGLGNLAIAFEKLKEKLQREGLFDPSHKKPIPSFPSLVVLITSETGAAIQDMLKIITNRNHMVNVLIFPCLVQGPMAAGEITAALATVNREFAHADTIILGRGGGSMEELWPFNEEIVARGIYASKIPVISAVGHETDFTIADFVSDCRAETPTAAAVLAVPDARVLSQRIDQLGMDLAAAMDQKTQQLYAKLSVFDGIALKQALLHRISWHQATLDHSKSALANKLEQLLTHWKTKAEGHKTELLALDPGSVMKRGYAAIIDGQGKLAGTIEQFQIGDPMTAILADGSLHTTVNQKNRRGAHG